MAAEFSFSVTGFDHASSIYFVANKMLKQYVPLKLYTDSKSFYGGIVELNSTTEKRLLTDLLLTIQPYERREIAEFCRDS